MAVRSRVNREIVMQLLVRFCSQILAHVEGSGTSGPDFFLIAVSGDTLDVDRHTVPKEHHDNENYGSHSAFSELLMLYPSPLRSKSI